MAIPVDESARRTDPAFPAPPSRTPAAGGSWSRAAGPWTALVVALLAFFPIANWIPGGHEAAWYHSVFSLWLSGGAIAIGTGVVLAILARRIGALWREGAMDGAVAA